MRHKDMDARVREAFSHTVPDILPDILADCEKERKVIVLEEKRKTSHWVQWIAGAAAVLILLCAGGFGFPYYAENYNTASIVSLDVNPSLEIQINRKERVLAVTPLNEDGRIVVGEMDFKGSSLEVTVNALVGSMLRNGYLSDLANSILISVEDQDAAKGAALQERLTQEIETLFQSSSFGGAVLSQTVSATADLQTVADTYGVTTGKAQLIQQLIAGNPLYSFEELAGLSINELNLLSAKGEQLTGVESVGDASQKAYIGEAAAKAAALTHAGVAEGDISQYSCELDYEYGTMVYEIEFRAGVYEYDYDINAATGEIMKQKKKVEDGADKQQASSGAGGDAQTASSVGNTSQTDNAANTSGSYIGEAKAKEIALSRAGVSADAISRYQIELDRENGMMVYEVEFHSGNYEYSFDIDATTGQILDHDREWDD